MDFPNGDVNFTVNNVSDLNLSDVIEVIGHNMQEENGTANNMVNNIDNQNSPVPYVEIIEQPAPKALRFRYECEGRSAGSIPGIKSTPDNKTFPTIQVKNYVGRAVVVVSCVTKDSPYKAHPHSIVGRDGCKKGVCTLEINTEDMKMVFSNLGIQCVKRRDIDDALKTREEIRVDPFRNGYNHRSQPSSIDLNAVRLCFQVFLEGPQRGKFTVPVKPVVSEPIFDKKSTSDLVITRVSHCSASCYGGQEAILLCEKVTKDDIQIVFYDENDSWEALADFGPTHVHKQVAISFKTPKYKSTEILEAVKVKMQLKRPSDGSTSEPVDFEILPLTEDANELKKGLKRPKTQEDSSFVAIKKSPRQDGYPYYDHNVKLEARQSPAQFPIDDFSGLPSPSPEYNVLSPLQQTITPLLNNNLNYLNPGQTQFNIMPENQTYNNFANPNYIANLPIQTNTFTNNQFLGIPPQGSGMMFGGQSSTNEDFGLMSQPRATHVPTSDQNMMSRQDAMSLEFILNNLSGDLSKISVSEMKILHKDS